MTSASTTGPRRSVGHSLPPCASATEARRFLGQLARALARLGTAALLVLSACRARHLGGKGSTDAGGLSPSTSAKESPLDASPSGPSTAASTNARGLSDAYFSQVGGFGIRFPDGKPPEVESPSVTAGLTVRLYKVRFGSSAYIVAHHEMPKGSPKSLEDAVQATREGLLETTGGTVDAERPFELDGHPGRELELSATTSGIKMRQHVRIVLVGSRLFQVLVVTPSWTGPSDQERAFFDSFRLAPSSP